MKSWVPSPWKRVWRVHGHPGLVSKPWSTVPLLTQGVVAERGNAVHDHPFRVCRGHGRDTPSPEGLQLRTYTYTSSHCIMHMHRTYEPWTCASASQLPIFNIRNQVFNSLYVLVLDAAAQCTEINWFSDWGQIESISTFNLSAVKKAGAI